MYVVHVKWCVVSQEDPWAQLPAYICTYDRRGKMGNFREPVFTCLPAAKQKSNVASG